MQLINSSDRIIARGTYLGHTIVNIASSGFESVADVLSAIAAGAGNTRGLLRVQLRNATQGWSQARTMYVAPAAPGTQLTLW
ncbi:MAG: hypothetical protein K2F99_10075 [Muribaculaceae bacterium]|nr:hypothetical protein [Muribaculaceae bacterium]